VSDPRFRVAHPSLPPLARYVEALEEVWDTGMLSNHGVWAQRLEDHYRAYFETGSRVLCASSCDVSLTLAIAALELPRGGSAVLPSLSYPSAVNAVEWNGLNPRFVDVDADDWCLHPEQLDGALDGAVLILATHMFGVPCDVAGLEQVAANAGAALVFDAAHAIATRVGERHVTDFGDASLVSLGATKLAPTAAGGLAVFRDAATAERFALLRNSGMAAGGVSVAIGLNAKLSELHAALAVISAERLETELSRREQLVDLYRGRLSRLGEVRLQRVPEGSRNSPSYLVIQLPGDRAQTVQALAGAGVETRPYFPALHLMPRFAAHPGGLPVTEALDDSLLALPLYSDMPLAAAEEICGTVCRVLSGDLIEEG
jgi:dTDP-4-amino-4,6-dideoxygalactose transaminase